MLNGLAGKHLQTINCGNASRQDTGTGEDANIVVHINLPRYCRHQCLQSLCARWCYCGQSVVLCISAMQVSTDARGLDSPRAGSSVVIVQLVR